MPSSFHPSSPTRPTIHDVARVAGVSKSTVSRVLTNQGYVSPETIAQVQRAIEELHYVPHSSARSLVSRRTNVLGLAVNDLATLFMPPLLSGIEAVTRTQNYNLLIAAVGHLREESGDLPLGPHNTDGLIVFADSLSEMQLHQLYEQNFPFVLMHRQPPSGMEVPCVNIRNHDTTKALIDHLINVHGSKRILFLRGPESQQDAWEREDGFRAALAENGLQPDSTLIRFGGFNPTIAAESVIEALQDGTKFDAVFAGDDEAAVGTIRALRKRGLRIPEDIAVVGFDDDHRAADIDPPLTTVHVPFAEVGQVAVRALIDLIESGVVSSHLLDTQLVVRRSCGCATNPV